MERKEGKIVRVIDLCIAFVTVNYSIFLHILNNKFGVDDSVELVYFIFFTEIFASLQWREILKYFTGTQVISCIH